MKPPTLLATAWALLIAWAAPGLAAGPVSKADTGNAPLGKVPGVVVDHSPQSSGIFIGSPSLAILPGGDYVASHDEFGPKSSEHTSAVSRVFRSADRGLTWRHVSRIDGQFWSTLFVHRGALYLIGTDRHHGNAIIRRSTDGGASWTTPGSAATGLLRGDGEYHCAPVPVLEHGGRLWRAMEHRDPPQGWGTTYRAGMLSVPADADLLNATNWIFSNFLPGDTNWLGNTFGGWLEGNAAIGPDGGVLDILRVDTKGYPEKAAMVRIAPDGGTASFNAADGFIDFPGGAKKFTIRHEPKSGLYWALATIVPERFRTGAKPASIRNTLALTCSPDLKSWTVRTILLRHPDTARHGFQYVDWLFDGDDIVALCRTAYDDSQGGAHNYHDANFLTFHRWRNFRNLCETYGGQSIDVGLSEDRVLPNLRKLSDMPLRDTSICRGPDGTWYMTGTVEPFWSFNEGIKLWRSPDLTNWTALGFVWKYGASPWHKKFLEARKPLWAPEVHYLKGTFWLTYSMPGWDGTARTSGSGLLRSASGKPEGPYEDVQPGERMGDEIDASLFQDDDGSVYFLWHSGKLAKMKADMSGLAEPWRWLKSSVSDPAPRHHSNLCKGIFGADSFDHVGFEGMFLFKAHGRYYLSCAESFEGRYSCMVATSTNLYGPYSQRYEAIPHGGHNMFFKNEQGRWWATYFGSDASAPWRERPGILPIRFDAMQNITVTQ